MQITSASNKPVVRIGLRFSSSRTPSARPQAGVLAQALSKRDMSAALNSAEAALPLSRVELSSGFGKGMSRRRCREADWLGIEALEAEAETGVVEPSVDPER